MLGTRGTSKIRVIVSDDDGDDGLPYHPRGQYQILYPPYKQQIGRSVTWRGILSTSCMDGCVHAYVHAWMGFGTVYPSVNDASACWGRARRRRTSGGMETAQRGEGRRRQEVQMEVVVVVMGKEFVDRAFEMTAESNGYLGQLPTLSGLQVADPGMADGWPDMK
jgi:hypothetical protein